MLWAETEERLRQYAESKVVALTDRLGHGVDGVVYMTSRRTAAKGFRYEPLYQRERDVYLRLREAGVEELRGFSVPQMFEAHDRLWVIEMSVVQPPFALDFAGAYLDRRPDYPRDVMRRWEAEKRRQFGPRWAEVRSLMSAFARHGIYLADVKPGNILFGDE
jgi:hypothetical protein